MCKGVMAELISFDIVVGGSAVGCGVGEFLPMAGAGARLMRYCDLGE